MRQYINSVSEGTELKSFISEEIVRIKKKLKPFVESVEDQVVQIKLTEVANLLNEVLTAKTIKDNHILSLLRYHELIKELKKI